MSKKQDYHVMPRGDEWIVKKEGGKTASVVTDTKKDAMIQGKNLAKNAKVELVEHGKNNKIMGSDSYGNDPCPPKDTKP